MKLRIISTSTMICCGAFLSVISGCGGNSLTMTGDSGSVSDGPPRGTVDVAANDSPAAGGGDADAPDAGPASGSGGAMDSGGATGGQSGALDAGGSGGSDGAIASDGGTDVGPTVCRPQSHCAVEGDTCETACAHGAAISCVCAMPLGAAHPEFLCASVQCSVHDGGAPDGAITIPACPATIVSRQTACDPTVDTICSTACVKMREHKCLCNGSGTKGTWVCTNNQSSCQ